MPKDIFVRLKRTAKICIRA